MFSLINLSLFNLQHNRVMSFGLFAGSEKHYIFLVFVFILFAVKVSGMQGIPGEKNHRLP